MENKIKLSNKIYPLFSGLSGDLLFWVAINTIFLTNVKGFSAAQISSLTTVDTLVSILSYPIVFKIIKKIGNIYSIRLGTILLLLSAILMTFSTLYSLILIGHILYGLAFLFKNMDNVILRKNLKFEGREHDYLIIQSKSSLIYSSLTMVIAFVSGFLFNINEYLPMYLCILFCIVNVVLSFFLFEYKERAENNTEENRKLRITKTILFILLLYAFLYATIDLGQANGKLFMQYKLSSFLDIGQVAIGLSFIISISRIIRVISNLLFTKYCNNKSYKMLINIGISLSSAFILIILGSVMPSNFLGIFLMAIGFFVFLGVRDPFANYMKTLLLNNCDELYHEKAITYLTVSRKTGKFLISTIITLLLLKIDMVYIMLLLLIVSVFNIFIIKNIYKLIKR